MTTSEGLTELHVSAAVKHGLELYSYSQAIICEGFKPQFGLQVATCATEFALHARRASELANITQKHEPLISVGLFRGGDIEKIKFEKTYDGSLNRLIHARTMAVNYVDLGQQPVFPKEKNFVLSYLQIETDFRETAFVSLFGISAHFLTKIAPKILELVRADVAMPQKPRSEI